VNILESKILKTENGIQELEIILEDEAFQSYFNQAYNKVKNKINVPGFRKGKVPFHIAKKQFGALIQEQALEDAAQESFEKVIETEKINLISRPQLINIDMNNGVVKFNFSYAVYPEITLNDYKGLTIDEPVHAVTDEEVEEEIVKILNSQGTFEDTSIVDDENHVVGLSFQTLINETKEPDTSIEPFEDHVYLNNERIDKKLVEILVGRKTGEVVEYVFEHDTPHDEHQHEEGETHQHIYSVTINDIQKLIPAELNDEFVSKYSNGKFENVDDFKDDVQFALQEKWDKESRAAVEDQIVAKLINDNDVPAPEPFVENATQFLMDNFKSQYGEAAKNMNLDSIKHEFRPMAVRNVQWELIRNKIIENENIEVEDYDIEQLATQEAARLNRDVEEVKKLIETKENLKMQILNKKVVDFVLDFAITNEVSFDDLKD
jgi:trigger factor